MVPERLRGEIARFDILNKAGKLIVATDKRITARHVREMSEDGISKLAVGDEFLMGRVLAQNIVDKDSGEIIANANDEITETVLAKSACRRRDQVPYALYQRSGSGRLYFPDLASG